MTSQFRQRRLAVVFAVLTIGLTGFVLGTFKTEQRKFQRVRKAYTDKESDMLDLLNRNSVNLKELRIYLRVFKAEEKIELWAKNNYDSKYKLIKEYEICSSSGVLGPKRKRGDLQVPEGFYHIDRFSPVSNFYLSLGLNYPNASDRILGKKGSLGGDIFIHGACVTIGCVPITDDKIKELYIFCVEAKDNGQKTIPVTVFPSELSDNKYSLLKGKYKLDSDKIGLWADLKQGFDYFNTTKKLPKVQFLDNGRHNILKGR